MKCYYLQNEHFVTTFSYLIFFCSFIYFFYFLLCTKKYIIITIHIFFSDEITSFLDFWIYSKFKIVTIIHILHLSQVKSNDLYIVVSIKQLLIPLFCWDS